MERAHSTTSGGKRRSAARADGTIRVDWDAGQRHLFWCPRGIKLGLKLQANTAAIKEMTDRCPECWSTWRKPIRGVSCIYLIWRHPGSDEVYVGEAVNPEHRYYTHFMYGNVPFLPTLEEYEELGRAELPLPYYEVIHTAPTGDGSHKRREREVAEDLRQRGFRVSGGR